MAESLPKTAMRLHEIAKAVGLGTFGEENPQIVGLGPIRSASEGQLSFVVGPKFLEALKSTKASAVIVPESLVSHAPCSGVISDNPYLSYAQITQILYPDPPGAGIHETATIAADASIATGVSIGPHSVIDSGASIGAGTVIGAGSYIGAHSSLGAGCLLHPNVSIYADCHIGERCRIQSGAVIGGDGFGYARAPTGWQRIQQVGRVMVGDRVEIGANTTIDRGALDDTVIEDDVILDNQIQIAHNVTIGRETAIAACVGIAGSTRIGRNCTIGGKAAIVGHLTIVDNVHLTATSFVTQSIAQAGSYSSGVPLLPTRRWRRDYVRLARLDDLFQRVKKMTQNSPND